MKNSFLFLLLLIATTYSCELLDPTGGGVITINDFENESDVSVRISPCEDGREVDAGALPQAALDYLNERLPNVAIEEVEIFDRGGTSVFGVHLEDDLEILFDIDGLVIRGGDDDDEENINLQDLPAAIVDYVAANFPNVSIDLAETELEFGESYIEVYLSNGQELYFDMDGDFLCIDDGHDDDDDSDDDGSDDDDSGGDDDNDGDYVSIGDLPSAIMEYIAANYPEYIIDEAELDDLCNDQPVYEVELERAGEDNEPDLYFDLDGNFLFSEVDILPEDLPAAVVSSLEANYPGLSIIADDVEQRNYPDGTVRYEVELSRGDDDDEVEVVVSTDGSITCSDDDDNGDDDDDGDDDDGDDDDTIAISSLPDAIRNYVAENYSDYYIEEAKKDDLCNDQPVYEVELERENDDDEPDLYFDLDGNFLFAETDISWNDLPDAVKASIEANYPNRSEIDDIERHDYPDGSVQYEVEIEVGDRDIDLVFAADGTILCRD